MTIKGYCIYQDLLSGMKMVMSHEMLCKLLVGLYPWQIDTQKMLVIKSLSSKFHAINICFGMHTLQGGIEYWQVGFCSPKLTVPEFLPLSY